MPSATLGMPARITAQTPPVIEVGVPFESTGRVRLYDPNNPQVGSYTRSDNSLRSSGKATIAVAIGGQTLGDAFGPHFARRVAYNVTAGDADIGLASAGDLIGLLAAGNLIGPARDAGPVRGVMQGASRAPDNRFTLTIGPVTSALFTF